MHPRKFGAAMSGQIGVQQYLPIQERRQEFSPPEQQAIDEGESRWLPRVFQSYGTPVAEMLASPGKQSLLYALLGGAAGGIGGAALGGTTGAAIGGALGAGVGGAGGYMSRQAENEGLKEMMRRLPPGATKRDLLSDPVYQNDQQQGQMAAMLSALESRRPDLSGGFGEKMAMGPNFPGPQQPSWQPQPMSMPKAQKPMPQPQLGPGMPRQQPPPLLTGPNTFGTFPGQFPEPPGPTHQPGMPQQHQFDDQISAAPAANPNFFGQQLAQATAPPRQRFQAGQAPQLPQQPGPGLPMQNMAAPPNAHQWTGPNLNNQMAANMRLLEDSPSRMAVPTSPPQQRIDPDPYLPPELRELAQYGKETGLPVGVVDRYRDQVRGLAEQQRKTWPGDRDYQPGMLNSVGAPYGSPMQEPGLPEELNGLAAYADESGIPVGVVNKYRQKQLEAPGGNYGAGSAAATDLGLDFHEQSRDEYGFPTEPSAREQAFDDLFKEPNQPLPMQQPFDSPQVAGGAAAEPAAAAEQPDKMRQLYGELPWLSPDFKPQPAADEQAASPAEFGADVAEHPATPESLAMLKAEMIPEDPTENAARRAGADFAEHPATPEGLRQLNAEMLPLGDDTQIAGATESKPMPQPVQPPQSPGGKYGDQIAQIESMLAQPGLSAARRRGLEANRSNYQWHDQHRPELEAYKATGQVSPDMVARGFKQAPPTIAAQPQSTPPAVAARSKGMSPSDFGGAMARQSPASAEQGLNDTIARIQRGSNDWSRSVGLQPEFAETPGGIDYSGRPQAELMAERATKDRLQQPQLTGRPRSAYSG